MSENNGDYRIVKFEADGVDESLDVDFLAFVQSQVLPVEAEQERADSIVDNLENIIQLARISRSVDNDKLLLLTCFFLLFPHFSAAKPVAGLLRDFER